MQPIFVVAMFLIKSSALLFYVRVFQFATLFRRAVAVAALMNCMWAIALLIVSIYECQPVHKAWDSEVEGTCINWNSAYISNAVPHAVIDLYILLLPMPMLWKLSVNWTRRLGLMFVFILGYL